MEILFDEYGDGDPNRLHPHLFRRGMEAAGLRTAHSGYVDEAPVEILSAVCMCGGSAIKPWCDGTHRLLAARARDNDETSG